jgi:probable rRNA maturation factor
LRIHLVTVGQRHSVPRRLLERVAREAMRATRAPSWAELEVALVGDATMARINRRYHGRRGSTDVLTFPSAPGRDRPVLGEIVISLPRARTQARRFGNSIRHEVALLLTHGILHLRGYDDQTPAAAARMQARAEAILRRAAGGR